MIDLEALKFVVPVLQKEINYKLEEYGFDWGKCPLSIRKIENEVEKLKVRNEGFSTRKFPERFKFKILLKQIFFLIKYIRDGSFENCYASHTIRIEI